VSGLTLNGGLQFASSSNRYAYPTDTNNFQPRVGAEYELNDDVVIRGGFGIIYFNTLESPLGQGFNSTTGYVRPPTILIRQTSSPTHFRPESTSRPEVRLD
jgi:hypothetical protein